MKNNDYELSKHFIGVVLDYDRDSREVAVYIPELMPTMSGNKLNNQKVPVNYGLTTDLLNTSTSIDKSNAMWVRAKNLDEPMPKVGSKVFVRFLENRITFGYWDKCRLTDEYEVIDEEKYSKLAELQINDKIIDVYEQDRISIQLPPNYDVISTIEDKTRTLTLVDNNTDYDSMKEQLKVLIDNNVYLLSRIKSQLIKESNKDVINGFDNYIGLTRTYFNRDEKLNNSFSNLIKNKIPEIINAVNELYELQEIENKINSLEKLFNILLRVDSKRVAYNNINKYIDLLTNIDNRIIDITNEIDDDKAIYEYIDYIESLLKTYRKVRFHYEYEPVIETEETVEIEGEEETETHTIYKELSAVYPEFHFDGESIVFDSEEGKIIDSTKLAKIVENPPDFVSFSKVFYYFAGWYSHTNTDVKLVPDDIILTDRDYFPSFIVFDVQRLGYDSDEEITTFRIRNTTESRDIHVQHTSIQFGEGEPQIFDGDLREGTIFESNVDLENITINITYTIGDSLEENNCELKLNN